MDIGMQYCCDIKSPTDFKEVSNIDHKVLSILTTILDKCKKEKESNSLLVPLEDYHERVSNYTGFPKLFIYTMLEDNCYQDEILDIYDHILLIECINNMYCIKCHPSFDSLYEECIKFQSIRSEKYKFQNITDLTVFKIKLYSWGYVYRKLKDGSVIIVENPKIKFDRFNYLNKIKNYRSKGKQIYYIDERQIFKDAIKKYTHVFNENITQTFDGFLYFHIITGKGYENGLFTCKDPDKTFSEIFKKWMLNIVLYSIQPGSVIVMMNNALHGALPTKSITRYHTKSQMQKWLSEKNIPYDTNMPKPILYDLIDKCTFNNTDYDIDSVFKSCGHDVLRLPKTFTSLTPITFFWNFLSKNFIIPNDSTAETVKSLLSLRIHSIGTEVWTSFNDEVIQLENDIYEIDMHAENLLEEYEFDNAFYE